MAITNQDSATATVEEKPTVGRPPIWYARISEKHTMAVQMPRVLREALDRAASEKGVTVTEHILDLLIESTRNKLPADLLDAFQSMLDSRE